MKHNLFILLIGLSCVLLTTGTVEAAIDISPKRIELRGDMTQTITISNNGERMEYVTIATELLLNPGVPFAEEQHTPMGLIQQPTLYASPFKLTLSPQQQKVITLRPLRKVERETVYRLNVRPLVQLQGTSFEHASAGIAVNLSFSAIIRQRPENEKVLLEVRCEPQGAVLTASGNVHVALREIQIDDTPSEDINIYPGTPQRLQGRKVMLPGYGGCHAGQRTEKKS
ncbi:fimbrial biogenesis chaperone [Serratia fonticola]|uniref:fimbrial biogenesis chaperone n=1 Tax=Serratia fonticola TaxID=47917 RepID=UPI00093FEE77|nr:hypothetical protein [Serratia fonticola]OKP21420.1 hypothetical protein BSQ40_25950 [Serratia fonticola]